jgi:hypothetical protein
VTPEEFKAALAKSGITPDKPLFAILYATYEAAETARDTVTDRARGLTPEGESALIERMSREAADATEAKVERPTRRVTLRSMGLFALAGLCLAGIGYGVGRWDGMRQGAHALEGAAFLATVAEMNDLRALRQHCQQHSYQQANGTACNLPPVWIRRTP